MTLKKIYYWIIGKEYKEEAPSYPPDFAIIDFSPIAKQNGIFDEQNKIIYRYFFDKYGNRTIKKYRYSRARIHSFQEVLKIPIFNKTIKEEVLPVFAKILPREIQYTTR